METSFAFFDVDCHERKRETEGFCLRPRVRPIGGKLSRLYDFAKRRKVRTVFTTCCDGKMLLPEEAGEILFVPTETDETWPANLQAHRMIYLHKRAWGTVEADIRNVAWDMFRHNENATRLFRELNIPRWIVFGNGVDLCVDSAARGILKAGYEVTVLDDVLISSAKGTPESMEATVSRLCAEGANRMPLDEFLSREA